MHKAASLEQSRFKDKDALELKKRKYPPSFDKPVDLKKIQLDVIKKWLAHRVTELNSGQEDEFLVNYIINLLEEKKPDPKKIQIAITGFLGNKNASRVIEELWDMLLDAQEHEGIPQALLENKKAEIKKRLEEQARVRQEVAESEKRDNPIKQEELAMPTEGVPNAWDQLDNSGPPPQEVKKERDDRDSSRKDDRKDGGRKDDRRDNRRDSLERRDDRRDGRDNRDARDGRDNRDGRDGRDNRDRREDRREDPRDNRRDNRDRRDDRRDDLRDTRRDDRRDDRREVRRDDRRDDPRDSRRDDRRDDRHDLRRDDARDNRRDDRRDLRKESPPRNDRKRKSPTPVSSSDEDNSKDLWKEKKRRLDDDQDIPEQSLELELRKKLEESVK